MKKLPGIVFFIAALVLGYVCGMKEPSPFGRIINDTIRDTIVDTIKYFQPIPKDSVVIRYKVVKLPVKDTTETGDKRPDSILVDIPIQQKEYEDSTYHAWVSGYEANLDSIHVFPKTIMTRQLVRRPDKRWGLGVQVGMGYSTASRRFEPYIGIGVSYNILLWKF